MARAVYRLDDKGKRVYLGHVRIEMLDIMQNMSGLTWDGTLLAIAFEFMVFCKEKKKRMLINAE